MTPKKLTIDDVRHHAEEVRDIAKRDTKQVFDEKSTQILIVAGVAVLAFASLTFLMGSRRGASRVVCEQLPPRC